MKNDARLDLRLPKELKQRIEASAEGSVNAWVRSAIEYRLNQGPTLTIDESVYKAAGQKAPPKEERSFKLKHPVDIDEIPLPKIAPRRWGK